MANFNIKIITLRADYYDLIGDYPGSSVYNRLLDSKQFYFSGNNAEEQVKQKKIELNNTLEDFVSNLRSDFNPEEMLAEDYVELRLYSEEAYSAVSYIINRKDISEEDKNIFYKVIPIYYYFPSTEQILKDLIKCNKILSELGYELIKDNDISENVMTKSSFKDLYNESELKSYILDEATLKDLLMSAGLIAGLGGAINAGTKELNKMYDIHNDIEISQQDNNQDFLKVPEKNKMPNLWNNVKTTSADFLKVPNKKDMSNLWKNNEVKIQPQKMPQKVKIQGDTPKKLDSIWSTETWKDADDNNWKLNDALAFIVDEENFSPKAYKDGTVTIKGKKVPRYSIGYGTLSPDNNSKAIITKKDAKEAMVNHVKKHILPKLQHFSFDSQNQFNSIVSFVYNTGRLPPLNNQGKVDWDKFIQYNKFQGKTNPGLQRRRNAEFFNAQLFDEI